MTFPWLPPVVLRYLENHGLVAITQAELDALRAPKQTDPDQCPYELFPGKFGPSHDRYLGSILEKEGDPMSGLNVVECAACGNISLSKPIALASP